jgi:sulfate adenylyltransferase subunit 2
MKTGSSLPPSSLPLPERRRRAVELRLAGRPLPQIRAETGLSAPTIIAAHKAFLAGGWAAIAGKGRGRAPGEGRALTAAQDAHLRHEVLETLPADGRLWTPQGVRALVAARFGVEVSERTVLRTLARWGLQPPALREAAQSTSEGAAWWRDAYPALARRARAEGRALLWAADTAVPGGTGRLLVVQTLRGSLAWLPVRAINDTQRLFDFAQRLRRTWAGPLALLWHGVPIEPLAALLAQDAAGDLQLLPCPVGLPVAAPAAAAARVPSPSAAIAPSATPAAAASAPAAAAALATAHRRDAPPDPTPSTPARTGTMKLTHLQRLEAESIHIMREVVAECEKPVMLYSIGKDSACMLHLAKKAFYPSPPPFPLLHVDTTWKFRDMYAMRERMAREMGMELLVWQNPEAKRLGINPFDHGSQIHTDMWKTQGLKQALDHYGFDAAFGGARRDEEKSRAKERIFSFRTAQHRWDPKNQRPELWHLYNARKHRGESIRVFPLSNWTELDIWQYIHLENIPIVPLYFAKERPVVERDGTLIMVDDERMPLRPGEVPVMRKVRFRTLGCYPLSGAIESDAETLTDIIQEMLLARTSERQGRLIDHDQAASMEKKKQEGYF